MRESAGQAIPPAYAIVAGMCASLVAIGLARFAYTPLIPLLIQAHWFAASDVVYLGAANFAGYFAGALCGRPLAARTGPRAALRSMMLVASLAFLACAWPAHVAPAHAAARAPGPAVRPVPLAVRVLYLEYAAVTAGLVPAAVFLVDFVARGLHQGAAHGALYWILYGVGAAAGPMLYGLVADRVGFGNALRLGLLLSGLASMFLAELPQTPSLVLASLLLGAFTPGVVTLVIGRLHELLAHDHDAQHAAWSRSTTMFALSQAVSGYGFSWLFAHSGGDYRAIYLVAVAAFALALLADLAVLRSRRPAG